jgi:hypothetical protein
MGQTGVPQAHAVGALEQGWLQRLEVAAEDVAEIHSPPRRRGLLVLHRRDIVDVVHAHPPLAMAFAAALMSPSWFKTANALNLV